MLPARTIAAAGGVVWRQGISSIEVALVHRPRYDDWTLPKGKLEPGEGILAAAVREVREELGADCAPSRRIGSSTYDVGGRTKTVTYWAMRQTGGRFTPGAEVDEVSWLSAAKALEVLTQDLDRKILRQFSQRPVAESVVVLVRHAKAGKRSEWPGDDAARPLDATGLLQAQRLVGFLELFKPEQIISADLTRCTQTVAPLAERLGLPVRIDRAFNDEVSTADMAPAYSALKALAKPGTVSVVCSQGYTIPSLVGLLAPDSNATTRKGAAWVLSVADGGVVAADYYDDPSKS